jgi:MSHA biogenesis protein MshI
MLPGLGARKAEGWLSIVRIDDRVDLAHVIRGPGKRPAIQLCDSYRIEGGERETLSRLSRSKGLKRYNAATLLDETQYRMAQLESPSVPVEERVQALRWRLKDVVEFPVEDAAVAVADIPTEGGRQANVFAIVAPRAVIAERMAAFHEARVPLEAIDIPEMAVRNVACLFEEPNRGLAFLLLGQNESLLTITFGGELYLSRRIEVSAQALTEADSERRQQLLERLALELQRTLDNFDRQYSFISVSRLMVCSEFDQESAAAALTQNLYLPVVVADLGQVLEFGAIPELRSAERQAQSLLAIGCALRSAR